MATRDEIETEALDRATAGTTATNYPAIYHGFTTKGIPESDILPRVNVFTFHAWRKLGRTVRRGEKGVKVVTWRTVTKTNRATGKEETFRRPWTATVFHVSQTVEL